MNDHAAETRMPPPAADAALPVKFRQTTLQVCILRLKFPGGHEFEALGREFGVHWPLAPNTTATGEAVKVLWLGPAEWVIEHLPAAEVSARAARACGATLHHVADVSEGRVVYELEGPKAREVLTKGCSLDLHPQAFGVGQCAQTLLHHANILLDACGPDRFRFYTDRSIAAWMTTWLEDATVEYRAG